MQYDLLLRDESWMQFHGRSNRTLARRPGENRVY